MKYLISKWSFLGIILMISQLSIAQFGFSPYEKYEQLIASKTIVVLTGDEVYDKAFQVAIKNHWKINSFAFMKKEDINKAFANRGYFVLVHNVPTIAEAEAKQFTTLSLLRSGFNVADVKIENVLAQSSINKANNTASTIELQVLSLINSISLMEEEKIIGTVDKMVLQQKEIILNKTKMLKDGNLIVDKALIDPALKTDQIKKLYPYDIKFVSSEELNKLFVESKDGFYTLFPSKNARAVIYNSKTGEAVFASKAIGSSISPYITAADFTEITKAIENK